jgi:hypothetical protein
MTENPNNKSAEDEWLAGLCSSEPEQTGQLTVYEDRQALVTSMRALASVLLVSNQVRIIVEKGGGRFDLLKIADANTWFAPMQLLTGTAERPRYIPGMKIYLEDSDRLEFEGITSDPTVPFRTPPHYSTWRGFQLQPRAGSWTLMRNHLLYVICGGSFELLLWLMCWMAQMLQQPERKLGTAVVLRGGKGTGKSTVAAWLREIIGELHSRKVSQGSHVTGKFNDHLRDCLFLSVEEGVWGGDKAAEGVLKDLITAPTLMIEPKGVGVVEFPNFTRILITSNEAWIVPASADERRFFVLDVAKLFEGDVDAEEKRRAYFEALYAEASNGGLEAMMAELLELDFTQVDLRKPPLTEGLRAQMAQTFSAEQEWLLSALLHGEFTRRDGERVGDVWEMDAPLKITRADLVASYNDHVRTYHGSPAGVRRLQTLLKAHGEVSEHRFTGRSGDRPYGYVLAPRQDWRERFERDHKFRFDAESAPVPDASGELISLDQFRSAA